MGTRSFRAAPLPGSRVVCHPSGGAALHADGRWLRRGDAHFGRERRRYCRPVEGRPPGHREGHPPLQRLRRGGDARPRGDGAASQSRRGHRLPSAGAGDRKILRHGQAAGSERTRPWRSSPSWTPRRRARSSTGDQWRSGDRRAHGTMSSQPGDWRDFFHNEPIPDMYVREFRRALLKPKELTRGEPDTCVRNPFPRVEIRSREALPKPHCIRQAGGGRRGESGAGW